MGSVAGGNIRSDLSGVDVERNRSVIRVLDDTVEIVQTPSRVQLEEEFEIFASVVLDSSWHGGRSEGHVQLDSRETVEVPVFVPESLLGVPHVDALVGNASEHFPGVREPGSVEDLEVEGDFEERGALEFGSDVCAAHNTHIHVVSAKIALHFVIACLLGALIDDGECVCRRAVDVAHRDETLTVVVRRDDETALDARIELSADGESSVVISADGADGAPRSLEAHLDFSATVALGVGRLAASLIALSKSELTRELVLPVGLSVGLDQTVGACVVLANFVDAKIVPEFVGLEEPHFELDGLISCSVHPVTT